MKKTETLFVGAGLIGALVAAGVLVWHALTPVVDSNNFKYPETKYGAFLAAQHAVYINDFERASEFMSGLSDVDYAVVYNTRVLSTFLGGKMPADVKFLANEKNVAAGLIYDAHLINNDKWDELYRRHKNDKSAITAPLRVWSSVETGRVKDALKFIAGLPTAPSWQAFMRGQIMAVTGKIDDAANEFKKVAPEFININDYMYMMSFYLHNGLTDAADELHREFTSRPGGMYMADFDKIPDWSEFDGAKNALAFGLVQNVSHTQIMMYTDLSLLLLRLAQISAPVYAAGGADAINYYIGQYFFNNAGDFNEHFDAISTDSPFYMFAMLRRAESSGDFSELAHAVKMRPLFVPGANQLVAHYISTGARRAALDVIDAALADKNINDAGRGHFLKSRAHVNMTFGDMNAAASDLRAASDIIDMDAEIFAMQAKIWAAQNREIENAYEYAMNLVKRNPTDVVAWDTLGAVVAVREGAPAALELLSRVGEVSNSCSSLFAQLGDLYAATGDMDAARASYMRAIELADDGMVVVPHIEKKLRKLK